MDLLKTNKRRSAISTTLYIALNIALAVAVLVVVQSVATLWPALLIVLLSKWRVLAVRPRYWLANIQANMIDLIVGVSVVVLLFGATGHFAVQVLLTVAYIGWLLFVKPRSGHRAVSLQAAIAIFSGVTALFMVSYAAPASVVVLGMAVIGYSAARHVFSNHHESHILLLSLVFGFIFAEIGWLCYHWAFAYGISEFGTIKIPQAAVIALGLSFVAERAYVSLRKNGSIVPSDVILPTLLTGSVIALLFILFNEASISI